MVHMKNSGMNPVKLHPHITPPTIFGGTIPRHELVGSTGCIFVVRDPRSL